MSGAPRILYVVADAPASQTTGGQIRQGAIRAALETVGPVTLLALDHGSVPVAWRVARERFLARRSRTRRTLDFVRGHVAGTGPLLHRARGAGFIGAFDDALVETDSSVVVLGAPLYGDFVTTARRRGRAVVIDAGESLARSSRSVARSSHLPAARRIRAALDATSFTRLERREYRRADQVWVASARDAEILEPLCVGVPIHVIPNPVPAEPSGLDAPSVVTAVAFLGSYLHPPNEAAALELMRSVMPMVRQLGGPSRATLIGRDPTAAMIRVASADPLFEVTGPVADVVEPLRAAGVLAVPIRSGAGTRIKILEAVAAGVPVVSTPLGAEGLGLTSGRDILIAESPRELATAIVRVSEDANLRSSLVRSAAAILDGHSPAAIQGSVRRALEALRRTT